jgi:hypothetical protein
MTRDEILQRYHYLRAISTGHHSGALKFLSRQGLLEHAKRLGLATGGMLVAESEAEMTLVFDLALYTAKEGRSRALDRYARATPLPRPAPTRPACWRPCAMPGSRSGASIAGTRGPG